MGSPDICLGTNPNHIFGEIFLPNLRYRNKHKKISPNMWFGLVPRHISGDPTILLSENCILGSTDICLGTTPNHMFSCVCSNIANSAHRNSPKLAQIICLRAILLSVEFQENRILGS